MLSFWLKKCYSQLCAYRLGYSLTITLSMKAMQMYSVYTKSNLQELTNKLIQRSRNLTQKLKITQVFKKFITFIDPKVHNFVHKSPSTPNPSATICAGFYSAGLGTCLIFMLDNYCTTASLDCILLICLPATIWICHALMIKIHLTWTLQGTKITPPTNS